jgi:hypothetical protein
MSINAIFANPKIPVDPFFAPHSHLNPNDNFVETLVVDAYKPCPIIVDEIQITPKSSSAILSKMYWNYVHPNLFYVILIILFGVWLAYRYYNKEGYELFRPTFNPGLNIESQYNYAKYMPAVANQTAAKLDSDYTLPPILVTPPDQDEFTGQYNTYAGVEPLDDVFPNNYLGYPMDSNRSTEYAVNSMTNRNAQMQWYSERVGMGIG